MLEAYRRTTLLEVYRRVTVLEVYRRVIMHLRHRIRETEISIWRGKSAYLNRVAMFLGSIFLNAFFTNPVTIFLFVQTGGGASLAYWMGDSILSIRAGFRF
jgi:hypothetical protein